MHQSDTAEEKIVIETRPSQQDQSQEASASYTQRFAQGAFWNMVGTIVSRLFAFASNVIVARLLGQVGFGELAMILSTLGVMSTFSGLGIGGTATKYVAELRLKDPERTGRIIGLTYLVSWTAGGLMALGCFLGAPWLAAETLNAPHLAPEIRLASLLLFVSAGFGPQAGILSGFQAFRSMAKVSWLGSLLNLPITVVLVWLAGLWGMVLALILSAFLGAVLYAWVLRREYKASQVRIHFRGAWQERPILWGFSLPAFLSSLILTPTLWVTNLILVHQPDGYAQLGLVNAATQFRAPIMAASAMVGIVSVSLMSEIHGKNDPARFARFFNLNLRLNWSLGLALGFGILLLSPWLIKVFGAKFSLAAPLLSIVICNTAGFRVANSIFGQIFYSSGRMWASFCLLVISSVVGLTAVFILVPKYGGRGLVLAYLIGSSFGFTLNLLLIHKIFGRALFSNITGCLIASILLVSGGLVLTFRHLFGEPMLGPIIVGLLAVIGILLILKTNLPLFQSLFQQLSEMFIAKARVMYASRKF
jgi:O-antigen/teichoic acid export membrane protein